ncbi:NADP-dependent oxidoreductase domain-containing protein [Kockiozyma suomiensis]|uniref:NADP-dependent oxidoreductase domain-containing protein n=1 Tax=Kockiozyma suomiensis TaxID=1337062 RepID=UPI003342EEBD
MSYPTILLGSTGEAVTALGFGAMGISAFYGGRPSEEDAFKVLDRAIELGVTFWDTAHVYGENEALLGRYFASRKNRDQIFLCTKCGVHQTGLIPDGSAEFVKELCAESFRRMGVDKIDLLYQHRVDPKTPIEITVGAMAELVKEGKVKYIGLSECSEATLRRAHKVHPITAIQIEYSPFTLDAEHNGLIAACKELGVTVVAYSPLSRGFLTGAYQSIDDFPEDDFRRSAPRFLGDNFKANLVLVDQLAAFAKKKDCTVAQLTLAWEIANGTLPIPGTTKLARLEENCKAGFVKFSEDELKELREMIEKADIAGPRYQEAYAKSGLLYGDTVEL